MTNAELVSLITRELKARDTAHKQACDDLQERYRKRLAEIEGGHANTVAALRSQVSSLATKTRRLKRQKDEAVGRAREYRAYASKYQRDLAKLRKEIAHV